MAEFRFKTEGLKLTKSERRIIDYIYQNLSLIPFLSIGRISEELHVSVATLSRFVRHVGYGSFKELKAAIMEHENVVTPASKLRATMDDWENVSMADLLLTQESYLAKTRENLSQQDVLKAIYAITQAKRIFVFGKGSSAGLADLLALRLNRYNRFSVRMHSSGSELLESMLHPAAGDLIILFGFHRMPPEAKALLAHAKENGVRTLLFTDRLYADADQRGDINLYVYRGEAKAYHCMAAPTALVDALVLLVGRELGEESIAGLHRLNRMKERYASFFFG